MVNAARVAWELHHGTVMQRTLLACHSCDNPICVNPLHLFAGTVRDNALDAKEKGRLATRHRHGMAKLTAAQRSGVIARIEAGETRRSIAASLSVSRSCIERIALLVFRPWSNDRRT
jgi:hypothetical protein